MKFSILLSIQVLCHSPRPIVVDPGTRQSTKLTKFWFADPGTLPFHPDETHILDLDPSAVLLDIKYMVKNSPSSAASSEPDLKPVLPTPLPTTGTYFWSPILDSFLI
jgi:hypothetical protein